MTGNPITFHGADVLSATQFGRDGLETLFAAADVMEALPARARLERQRGRLLVSAFFQTSTRTRLSFESAILRLGGCALGFADPKTTRAGDYEQESLADTITMCAMYGDVIVLRHPDTGAASIAAGRSEVPLINAGDGYGEHPTQIFADLYTVRRRLGRIDGLRVGLLGDLRVRCMHSMLLALSLFDCDVVAVSPPDRQFSQEYLRAYEQSGRTLSLAESVDEILPRIDVLYMGSAIQQPDFSAGHDAPIVKPATPNEYCVNLAKLRRGAPRLAVLHALARGDELCPDVDASPYNAYWAQAANAVTVRMALLDLVLNGEAG
jgi:aspartate carbamoyltransferase catalytic subunit